MQKSVEINSSNSPGIEYVFCIGTGRNGSEYLSKLLSCVKDCSAEHEPVPRCNRKPMRSFLNGKQGPLRSLMKEKLAQISRSKGGNRVYVETNHSFIKGFGWLIPEYIDQSRIAVIVLTRDKAKVARSFQRIEVTCLSETGRNWLIAPVRKGALVAPPKRILGVRLTYYFFWLLALPFRHRKYFKQLGLKRPGPEWVPQFILDYERDCLEWYVEETQALTEEYRKRFPQIRYCSMTIDDINDPEKIAKLLDFLGLKALPSMQDVVGVPTNLKR